MKKNIKKLTLVVICLLLLTGCTKTLKDDNKKVVTNPNTGQALTSNIICKPTEDSTIKQYKKHKVDIEKLPACNTFNPVSNYEGIWTSFLVKPLAWLIIKIGTILKSYGFSIIITCLLIRFILMPVTKKTAVQSENMKDAKPDLDKLEKKYKGKESQDDQARKAQEMMLIYKKYNINPISGCLLGFIQIPLVIAFYEAINRTPAIFEDNFLGFNMGVTPMSAIQHGKYIYIILIILIMVTTYFSFRKAMKDQSVGAGQMKGTLYFMLIIILITSFSLSTAIGIYWITSSLFTIFQNIMIERRHDKK